MSSSGAHPQLTHPLPPCDIMSGTPPFPVALVHDLIGDIQEEATVTEKAVPVGRSLGGEAEVEV